jgi:hypothetical protein
MCCSWTYRNNGRLLINQIIHASKLFTGRRLHLLYLFLFIGHILTWHIHFYRAIVPGSEMVSTQEGKELMNFSGHHISEDPRLHDEGSVNTQYLQKISRYYVIPTPEITTWIVGKYSNEASRLYADHLNENRAEIWLHRAFESQEMSNVRTLNASEADVFVIGGYFNLIKMIPDLERIWQSEHASTWYKWVDIFLSNRIIDKKRPHLILSPCTATKTWHKRFMKAMVARGINVWSVGFERNEHWQGVRKDRIIPIPYVVEPSKTKAEMSQNQSEISSPERTENFVFFSGDQRRHAVEWAGCDRVALLSGLLNYTKNMHVRIVSKKTGRLPQSKYNSFMETSDFCLIMCGDTPSSRSLTTAVIYGCIPLRIGSRWRGLCEPPCKEGWKWTVTGPDFSHLPFPELIDWDRFPEIDEMTFASNPLMALEKVFSRVGPEEKKALRSAMAKTRLGWIYGWGDPVTSNEFGDAPMLIWNSFAQAVQRHVHVGEYSNNSTTVT